MRLRYSAGGLLVVAGLSLCMFAKLAPDVRVKLIFVGCIAITWGAVLLVAAKVMRHAVKASDLEADTTGGIRPVTMLYWRTIAAKEKIFWAVLLAIGLVVTAISVEFLLQIREYRHLHGQVGFSSLYKVDPFLQIRPKFSEVNYQKFHVNEDSFRGDAVSHDFDTYRIFTLGGSTTWSSRLPYEQSYPAKLEAKLKAKSPGIKIQVQNAACDWYTTEHSIIRYLFYVRHYKPNLIIVKHAVNDLVRSFAPEWWCRPGDGFRRDYSHYLGPVVRLARKPYFPFRDFLLWKKIFGKPKPEDIDPHMPDLYRTVNKVSRAVPVREFKSLEVFEENLRILVNAVKSDSTKVILLTQPDIFNKHLTEEELATLYFGPVHCSEGGVHPDVASLEYGMSLFNQAVIRVAKELEVPVVDLDKSVPKSGTYFFDDVHLKEP